MKRYYEEDPGAGMSLDNEDGDWVKYEDAQAELDVLNNAVGDLGDTITEQQARIDELKKLIETHEEVAKEDADTINRWAARAAELDARVTKVDAWKAYTPDYVNALKARAEKAEARAAELEARRVEQDQHIDRLALELQAASNPVVPFNEWKEYTGGWRERAEKAEQMLEAARKLAAKLGRSGDGEDCGWHKEEYGGGAEIRNKHGQYIADFESHLDAEAFLELLEALR